MHHARPLGLRRVALYAALVVLVGAVSLTLAQCTMVGDKVTGVDLNQAGPTTCIKQCNDQYKLLFDQEQKLHRTNIEICQALPQPQRGDCLKDEETRHEAAKAALAQAKIDCQNNCHTQGGGSGG